MPTTITGNSTGTAAPSAQPDPDTVPVLSAPADGDADSAASVAQAFQALANEVAFGKRPTAGTPANPTGLDANFVQPIRAFRNVAGKRRFAVDHRGYPIGNFLSWQETWDDIAFATKSIDGTGGWAKRWYYYLHQPGSTTPIITTFVGASYLGSVAPNIRTCQALFDSGPTGPAITAQMLDARNSGVIFNSDFDISLTWDSSGGSSDTCAGITNDSAPLASTSLFVTANPVGAFFYATGAMTTWHVYVRNVGGTAVTFDTGVGFGAADRMRIDVIGANCADDGTARAIFFINGSPVANEAVDFDPHSSIAESMYFPCFRDMSSSGRNVRYVGHVNFACNKYAGDIAY